MKAHHKRLIIGFASLAVLDLAGFITMVANPDLTARVIPALAGVQIFGFIAIAILVVTSRGQYISSGGAVSETQAAEKQWVPWLFGFLALLSFMRVILALLYIAGEEGHSHSWFSVIAGVVMGSFFLWIALRTKSSVPSLRE